MLPNNLPNRITLSHNYVVLLTSPKMNVMIFFVFCSGLNFTIKKCSSCCQKSMLCRGEKNVLKTLKSLSPFRVRGTQPNTRVHLKTSVSHEQKTRDQYVFFSSWNSTRDHLKNSMLAFRMLPRGQLNISFVLSCQWAKSKGWKRKAELFFFF